VDDGRLSQASVKVPVGIVRPASLRENTVWSLLGNLTYGLAQWATVSVIARLGSVEMVGQFALGLAVTAPIVSFLGLPLRQLEATDMRDEFRFGDYLSLRMMMMGLAIPLAGCASWLLGYGREKTAVVLAVAMAKAIEAISDVIFGRLQRAENMKAISLSLIVKGALGCGAVTVALVISKSALAAAIALAIVWFVILMGFDVRNLRATLMKEERGGGQAWVLGRQIGTLAYAALPLGVVMLMNSLVPNVPRYLLEQFHGERELGIFAGVWYLAMPGAMLATALGQAVCARLASFWATGRDAEYRHLLLRCCVFAVAVGMLGLLVGFTFGGKIAELAYGVEYKNTDRVVVAVMAAGLLMNLGSILGYGATARRRIRQQVPVQAAGLGVTCLLGLYLVRRFAAAGGAWCAVIVGFGVAAAYGVLAFGARKPEEQMIEGRTR
jgi:O-antigen/teichoic acid export membrane protein